MFPLSLSGAQTPHRRVWISVKGFRMVGRVGMSWEGVLTAISQIQGRGIIFRRLCSHRCVCVCVLFEGALLQIVLKDTSIKPTTWGLKVATDSCSFAKICPELQQKRAMKLCWCYMAGTARGNPKEIDHRWFGGFLVSYPLEWLKRLKG